MFRNIYCQGCRCYFTRSCLMLHYQRRTRKYCIDSLAVFKKVLFTRWYRYISTFFTNKFSTALFAPLSIIQSLDQRRIINNCRLLIQLGPFEMEPQKQAEYSKSFEPDEIDEVESSWNVMAHGDAREAKWRGKWQLEWVVSIRNTTSEHGFSNITTITTSDVHTSTANSRLYWLPARV